MIALFNGNVKRFCKKYHELFDIFVFAVKYRANILARLTALFVVELCKQRFVSVVSQKSYICSIVYKMQLKIVGIPIIIIGNKRRRGRMTDFLDNLNDSQREAVTSTEGYVRVIAGAGTGKTRALTYRFAYLVNVLGIMPENILCVTFTNKSANEMKRRIHNLTGDNDTAYICTFHSFCVSVLQEDINAVHYPEGFLVLDNADIDAMLKIIYEERGLTLRHMTFSNARDMIEIRKLFEEPQYYLDLINMSPEVLKEKYLSAERPRDIIFYGYLYQQKKCFGLDYNDLIKFTLYIFSENEAIKLKWQKKLEYIMIDEFQDIDSLQYELMSVLCGYHKNLFVVGDYDQTIYTWRGANVKYLLEFDGIFPGTKTVMMTENYRSTPEILAVANSLIDKNTARIKKNLIPTKPHGPEVLCIHAESGEREAEYIADRIKSLVESGEAYRDMCVMYRSHYVTRSIEEVFLKKEIPYVIYSGVQFFNRAEIKDALSYLRMVVYRDDLSFVRTANTPKRNLGERRMKFLREYAEANGCSLYDALKSTLEDEIFKNTKATEYVKLIEKYSAGCAEKPTSELLTELLDKSGYEKMLRTEGDGVRLDNLAELKQSIYEYETTCGEETTAEHYLARVALFTSADIEEKSDKVKLMTVHTAKGLEFPHVFLCSMNEGVFPAKKTASAEDMEEERRLAFVAFTRAEKGLYISEAEGRNFDGSPRFPSRFILDVDESLLTFTTKPRDGLVADAREYISLRDAFLTKKGTETAFKPGERVRHSIFGEGTVVECCPEKAMNVVQFDEADTPRSISFKAKLEKI